MRLFLDTNVLLDCLLDRAPFNESTRIIWALAEERRISGAVFCLSLPTIYYVMRKTGRANAEAAISRILSVFECMPCDESMIY